MAKLSKEQVKRHNEACTILEKDILTYDDKIFVLENWNEGAKQMNGEAGAFFTPMGLARDFQLCISYKNNIIDLCAGIGMLSYHVVRQADLWERTDINITCVELNHSYYEVGKKIVPEAKWIHGSVFDMDLMLSLGKFDQAISNPPFGNVRTGLDNEKQYLKYTGSEFELKVIEVASLISKVGAFILPQQSTPFQYSGKTIFNEKHTNKSEKFSKQTGLEYEFNMGIDTSVYINDWKGVSPMCEIVLFDFTNKVVREDDEDEEELYEVIQQQQLSLF